MVKGNVETVLSNDGKTRLKGNVGSHSTLVTQAKAPTTNISKVDIQSKTKPVDWNEDVAKKDKKLIFISGISHQNVFCECKDHKSLSWVKVDKPVFWEFIQELQLDAFSEKGIKKANHMYLNRLQTQ